MARTALVTGAVTGIGAATARLLRAEGYNVIGSHFGLPAEAREFEMATGIPVHEWDVANFEATRLSIGKLVDLAGPVDVLVNNAGITSDGLLQKMSYAEWRSVIEVDLIGCFNTCHAVVGDMRRRRFGRIINISCIAGLSGHAGQTNYAAAKAGVIGFTKALALECAADGVTVNTIAPGFTDTRSDRTAPWNVEDVVASVPVGRLAAPEEIARGVLFLAAEDAGYITGATLCIDGGRHLV